MTWRSPIVQYLALFACFAFLAFGLIRVGVGIGLLAQQQGYLAFEGFVDPLTDTTAFLERGAERALLPLNVASYLGYIAVMGICLAAGAIGALRRQVWGVVLIAVYLALHGLLFVNYLTINPKITLFFGGIFLLFLVAKARLERTRLGQN